jgi:hypothetical protein
MPDLPLMPRIRRIGYLLGLAFCYLLIGAVCIFWLLMLADVWFGVVTG